MAKMATHKSSSNAMHGSRRFFCGAGGWVLSAFFSFDGLIRGGGGGEVVMLIKDIAWQWMRVSFKALKLHTLIKDIALQ